MGVGLEKSAVIAGIGTAYAPPVPTCACSLSLLPACAAWLPVAAPDASSPSSPPSFPPPALKCGEESITPAGLKRSVRQWRFPSPTSPLAAVPSSQVVQDQRGMQGVRWGSASGSASSSGGGGVGGGSGSASGESAKTGAGQGSGDASQRGDGASGGGANQASGSSSEGADKHESGDGGGADPCVDGGGEDGSEGVTVRVSHVDAHRLLCCVGLNEEYFDLVDVDR